MHVHLCARFLVCAQMGVPAFVHGVLTCVRMHVCVCVRPGVISTTSLEMAKVDITVAACLTVMMAVATGAEITPRTLLRKGGVYENRQVFQVRLCCGCYLSHGRSQVLTVDDVGEMQTFVATPVDEQNVNECKNGINMQKLPNDNTPVVHKKNLSGQF